MEDLFLRFKKQFIEEIVGLLEQIETDLLEMENSADSEPHIDSVFRAMHTIKGTSGMYGCLHISDFTHHLENIFQRIRDSKTVPEKGIVDVTLSSLDHIRRLIDDEELKDPHNIEQHQQLLSEITKYTTSDAPTPTFTPTVKTIEKDEGVPLCTWYILIRTDEQIFFRGVSLVNILSDLACLGSYHIHRVPSLSDNETETWGIVLISAASLSDIKEVFMFIEDNCSFVLIKEGNLLEEESEDVADVVNNLLTNDTKVIEAVNTLKEEPKLPKIEEEPKSPSAPETATKRLKTSLLVGDSAKHNLKRISVDSVKLDYLMYLVSELITLNSQLLETTKDDYYERIRPQIEKMEDLAKLFRNNALEIRLVPLNDLVLKFQRLVRDLSKQLGKQIEFVTQGTDTELDKNTIDLIAEPLIHIIRNSVDHGIEMPDERIAKNKEAVGTIKLSAHHVGNYIHIKIEDNGAGLNLDRIREKAIEKGIIRSSDILTKSELTNLIFHSGFSTAQSLTNVSGRGVGMDVVKRKITELRGEIFVDTEKGQGTTITLKIQQSVAIIDSLLFRVQNSYFILPLTEIRICEHTEKAYLLKNQNTCTIEYHDMMIPYFDLRSTFNLGGEYPDPVKTLILDEEGQHIAILCDEILGELQAVLKPLGQAFDNKSGVLAVTQHGDGKWAYMLNTHFLFNQLKNSTSKTSTEAI